jgi:hypothetical protein
VSSVSTDYIVIQSTDIRSSVTSIDRGVDSPIVISLGSNDNIIAEPVTSPLKTVPHGLFAPANTELHVESSTVTHSVQAVKQKFVIRGGQVQRTQDIPKSESPPDLTPHDSKPMKSHREQSEISVHAKGTQPQRKRRSPKKHVVYKKKQTVTGESDGWSTEGEVENIQATIQIQPVVPATLTNISALKVVQVSHLVRSG